MARNYVADDFDTIRRRMQEINPNPVVEQKEEKLDLIKPERLGNILKKINFIKQFKANGGKINQDSLVHDMFCDVSEYLDCKWQHAQSLGVRGKRYCFYDDLNLNCINAGKCMRNNKP